MWICTKGKKGRERFFRRGEAILLIKLSLGGQFKKMWICTKGEKRKGEIFQEGGGNFVNKIVPRGTNFV